MYLNEELEDFPLWCYLDYWKFEDFIERSALFFAFRNTFNDACEGEDTKYRQLERKLLSYDQISTTATMASVMNGGANGTFIPMDPCYIQNANLSKFNNTLDNTGINCWTLYKDYNENMAETFCKGFATNNFVAIKTTFLPSIILSFTY